MEEESHIAIFLLSAVEMLEDEDCQVLLYYQEFASPIVVTVTFHEVGEKSLLWCIGLRSNIEYVRRMTPAENSILNISNTWTSGTRLFEH